MTPASSIGAFHKHTYMWHMIIDRRDANIGRTSMKAGLKFPIDSSLVENWEQINHFDEVMCSRSALLNFNQTEVLN